MKLNQKKLEANLIKLSEKMATMSPEEIQGVAITLEAIEQEGRLLNILGEKVQARMALGGGSFTPEELEAINKAEIRVNDLYLAIELATGINIMNGVVEDE